MTRYRQSATKCFDKIACFLIEVNKKMPAYFVVYYILFKTEYYVNMCANEHREIFKIITTIIITLLSCHVIDKHIALQGIDTNNTIFKLNHIIMNVYSNI